MSAKTWPAVTLLALAVVPGARATVIVESPGPVSQGLRVLATGHAKPPELAAQIESCWAYRESRFPGCTQRLQEVFEEFAATGKDEQKTITDAVDLVMRGELGRSKWAPELNELSRRISSGWVPLRASAPSDGGKSFARDAAGKGPPTEAELGRVTLREFNARLLTYVDTFLPAEDRAARINEALKASVSSSCETLFGGKAMDTCRNLSLTRLRLASLRLAMMELRGSRGDPETLKVFLDLGPERLNAVLETAELSNDEGLMMDATLVRRWIARRPNRWQAWADIEEVFGPR